MSIFVFTFGMGLAGFSQIQYSGLDNISNNSERITLNTNFQPLYLSKGDSAAQDSILQLPEKRILDVSEKLLITTGVLFKSHSLTVENVTTGKRLQLSPTGSANIAFGVNYKWMGIAFSFGLPATSQEKKELGETQKHDFQLNFYTNTFVVQAHLQRYKGFHAELDDNGEQVEGLEKGPIISSLETYSVGLSSYYFFNHKKFSYKAAYVRNAVQIKSAGSVVGGIFYSLDLANANTSFADEFPDSIKVDFDVVGYRSRSIGISAGYTYTFVIKEKFFINATMVPGIGLKNVSLFTEKEEFKIDDGFIGRLAFNFSMGYEAKHFIVGMRTFNSNRFLEANGFRITPSTNSVLFYVSKRFNVKRKKK